ncbi:MULTISPECIES: OmpA family protein [unclassified Desulfurobacterium]|uniref:OmpA family protein n=1 Tax=unclassified Desulfurobacterium TaxID=2639089 RepID=UPI0003B33ED3|nr:MULTISPECIES: OmpA family protein [unclassified Desulfurobacterium]
MRIKILPLLATISTIVVLSGCGQTVVNTGVTITIPPKKAVPEVKVSVPSVNREEEALKEAEGKEPQIEVSKYIFENEVKAFRDLTGAKVIASVPLFGHLPSIKGDLLVVEEPQRVRIIIKDSLIFELNRDRIVNDSVIKAIAQSFNGKNSLLVIAGFSDSTGTDDFNNLITERRAEAVKKELESLGIPSYRILAFGCGSSKPIAPNSTVDGRAANRRVEVYVYPENMYVDNVCGQR